MLFLLQGFRRVDASDKETDKQREQQEYTELKEERTDVFVNPLIEAGKGQEIEFPFQPEINRHFDKVRAEKTSEDDFARLNENDLTNLTAQNAETLKNRDFLLFVEYQSIQRQRQKSQRNRESQGHEHADARAYAFQKKVQRIVVFQASVFRQIIVILRGKRVDFPISRFRHERIRKDQINRTRIVIIALIRIIDDALSQRNLFTLFRRKVFQRNRAEIFLHQGIGVVDRRFIEKTHFRVNADDFKPNSEIDRIADDFTVFFDEIDASFDRKIDKRVL